MIVEDSQLSLAIGKKGQNVRLASKLIGWDIDIKSEEEKRREIEEQMTALTAPTTPLTVLAGVGPKTIEKIEAAGIANLEKLASMTPEQLMEIPGIGEKMVDKIYQAVNRFYEGGEAAATAEATENTDVLAEDAAPETAEAGGETQEAEAKSAVDEAKSGEVADAETPSSETAASEGEAEASSASPAPEGESNPEAGSEAAGEVGGEEHPDKDKS